MLLSMNTLSKLVLCLVLALAGSSCADAPKPKPDCRPYGGSEVQKVEDAYSIVLKALDCRHEGFWQHRECYTVRNYAPHATTARPGDPPFVFELYHETPNENCGKGGTTTQPEALFGVYPDGRVEEVPYP
jgi:hypothetical protein